MHSALYPLFHHCTGNFVRLVDIPVVMIVVRIAAARANEFRKTILTFLPRKQAGIFEQLTRVVADYPLVHAAHTEFVVAHELMTGIQIPVRRNRKILVTCAASGYPFRKTRPAL